MSLQYEVCCNCNEHTGRAGAAEDSIYFEDFGPYCEGCRDDIGNIFATRITALENKVKRLRQLSNSDLSSNDLKAAERHCDWQQFKHAWNAVFNLRNAAKELE